MPSQCQPVLIEQTSKTQCVLGHTFGCRIGGIWTTGGCRGRFRCDNGHEIECGHYLDDPHTLHFCRCTTKVGGVRDPSTAECRARGMRDPLCDAHLAATCANLSKQLYRREATGFAPWGVENSVMGWRYHICGAPPRRQKSWVGQLLDACGEGRPISRWCSSSPRPSRRVEKGVLAARGLPVLLPAVRTLLEFLARRLQHRLQQQPRGEGMYIVLLPSLSKPIPQSFHPTEPSLAPASDIPSPSPPPSPVPIPAKPQVLCVPVLTPIFRSHPRQTTGAL